MAVEFIKLQKIYLSKNDKIYVNLANSRLYSLFVGKAVDDF
jgi:hypothetical protein